MVYINDRSVLCVMFNITFSSVFWLITHHDLYKHVGVEYVLIWKDIVLKVLKK